MKICSNCGASNPHTAKFCNECGNKLISVDLVPAKSSRKANRMSLGQSIATMAQELQNKRKADIMFVLDCTGSMQGEIDAIKETIMDFADTIELQGVRVRVGLVEFRDRLINQEHRVLLFDGEPFTGNSSIFRQEVAKLRAGGGGDEPESSLDALMLALRQPFSSKGNKVIVLITDAPPHIPDKETKSIEEVLEAIKEVELEQLYLIMQTQSTSSQVYLKLLEGTRGMAFELGKGNDFRSRAEHFKQTLMNLGKTISQTI